MSAPDPALFFGYPEEGEKFQHRHPLWAERFPNLVQGIEMAFSAQTVTRLEDKFIYMYGRICVEDFMEILLVCGNGYGTAGLKLVRSMYEHSVAVCYFQKYPGDIEKFVDFHVVQQHRMLTPLRETFGDSILSAETIADVETRFASVKKDFVVTDCSKCKTQRLNHTWGLDFVTMAKRAGDIGKLIVSGYYIPLRHAHSTFAALSGRIEQTPDGMVFVGDNDPKDADHALMTAHNCLLYVLGVEAERFKIQPLNDYLQTCFRDFLEIWAPDSEYLKGQ